MFFVRIGEAAHPGPESIVLGTSNPSGLSNKALSYLELDRGIWNVAETQLTDVGFHRFSKELRAFQQSERSVQIRHGAFAPPRARSTIAGSRTGVAQISDVPMRSIREYHGEVLSTNREEFSFPLFMLDAIASQVQWSMGHPKAPLMVTLGS